MKYVIFTIILTITATPIYARDWNRFSQVLSYCDDISKLAKVAMEARQMGISKTATMNEIMKILDDPGARRDMKEVIDEAYRTPIYPSGHQSPAINAFRHKIRLECMNKYG